jgi:hypothetical protein
MVGHRALLVDLDTAGPLETLDEDFNFGEDGILAGQSEQMADKGVLTLSAGQAGRGF